MNQMVEPTPQISQPKFNWAFVFKSAAYLTPIVLMAVVFMLASRAQTGYMIGTFDVVLTHYRADVSAYAPLLPTIDGFFKARLSDYDYGTYFGLMAIAVCLYAPFVLLYRITGDYRVPLVFTYATAIPIFNLINGTIPQALVIDFMLLGLAFPKRFLWFVVLAGLAHSFGLLAMVVTWGWMRWVGWKRD